MHAEVVEATLRYLSFCPPLHGSISSCVAYVSYLCCSSVTCLMHFCNILRRSNQERRQGLVSFLPSYKIWKSGRKWADGNCKMIFQIDFGALPWFGPNDAFRGCSTISPLGSLCS